MDLVYVINVLEVPSLKQTSYIRSFFYPPGKISLPSPDGSETRVLGGIFRATPLAGLDQVHQHDFFSAAVNSADLDSLTKWPLPVLALAQILLMWVTDSMLTWLPAQGQNSRTLTSAPLDTKHLADWHADYWNSHWGNQPHLSVCWEPKHLKWIAVIS